MKCNIPFLVHNKFNKDLAMCNTTQDFAKGNNNYNLLLEKGKHFLVCTAVHQLDMVILYEELELTNQNCKPTCEIWSYDVAKMAKVSHTGMRGQRVVFQIFTRGEVNRSSRGKCSFFLLNHFN